MNEHFVTFSSFSPGIVFVAFCLHSIMQNLPLNCKINGVLGGIIHEVLSFLECVRLSRLTPIPLRQDNFL